MYSKRISVVIPSFNRKSMVQDAVESVLATNLDDLDVVVVDDGSTDDTMEILRKRFGNAIRLLFQEHKGRSAARNHGALVAVASYIVFLDSDDLVLPEGLGVMAKYLDDHPSVDIVYADGYYCDGNGNILSSVSEGRPSVDPDRILETLVLHNIISAPHLAMLRRQSLESSGYPYFDEELDGMEDADLWIRLAAQGHKFGNIAEIVGKYRLHGSGNESSPLSPNRPRREESVIRFKLKILSSQFFSELSLPARMEFVRQLLQTSLRGKYQDQESVLKSHAIQSLPDESRSKILYLLGTEAIIQSHFKFGKKYLGMAMNLAPSNKKFRTVYKSLRCSPLSLRVLLIARRRWIRWRKGVDKSVAPHWRQ